MMHSSILLKKEIHLKDEVLNSAMDIQNAILSMEKLPLFGHLWNFDTHIYVNEDFIMNIKLIDRVNIMACMSYVGYH